MIVTYVPGTALLGTPEQKEVRAPVPVGSGVGALVDVDVGVGDGDFVAVAVAVGAPVPVGAAVPVGVAVTPGDAVGPVVAFMYGRVLLLLLQPLPTMSANDAQPSAK